MALDLGELFVKIAAHTQGFDTAENALKKMTKEQVAFEKLRVKQAQQTNKILTKEMSKVSKSARDSAMVFKEYHKQAEMSNKANRALSGTLEQVELGFVSAGTRAHGASRRLSAATSRSRGFGLGLQNASYQMQDIIVQWEMGVDKARILGQQLPQLLGGFGALGALAGVGAAGLAIIVGSIMNSGDEAEKAAKKIDLQKESLDQLVSIVDKASESFARYRGLSRDFELKKFKDAVREANTELEKAYELQRKTGEDDNIIEKQKRLQDAQYNLIRAQVEQTSVTEYTLKSNIALEKQLNTLFDAYNAGKYTLQQYNIEQEIAQEIDRQGLQGKQELIKLLREEITLRHYRDKERNKKDKGNTDITNLQLEYNRALTTLEDVRMIGPSIFESVNKAFADISIVKKFEDSLHGVTESQLAVKAEMLGIEFDPNDTNETKVKKVAKAMGDLAIKTRDADEETKKLMASQEGLKEAINKIISDTASLFGQISSQYAALASYHAQMAQQALDYGRTQSDVYMRIADSIYYSNNALAQSYQERAYAVAEAAAAEYQAQKEAQDKANAIAKDNFENQKKLQMVQAIMSTANAVMKAYAELGPFGAPVATAMAALGAAQVGIISQQQYTPREKGGPFVGGQGLLVGERGPELLIPNRGGTVVNNKDLMNGLSGGGSTSINFTIQAIDTSDAMKIIYENRSAIVNIIQQEKNRTMGAQ